MVRAAEIRPLMGAVRAGEPAELGLYGVPNGIEPAWPAWKAPESQSQPDVYGCINYTTRSRRPAAGFACYPWVFAARVLGGGFAALTVLPPRLRWQRAGPGVGLRSNGCPGQRLPGTNPRGCDLAIGWLPAWLLAHFRQSRKRLANYRSEVPAPPSRASCLARNASSAPFTVKRRRASRSDSNADQGAHGCLSKQVPTSVSGQG
jgi:hypothetical protein